MFSEIDQKLVEYVKAEVSEVVWEKALEKATLIGTHAPAYGYSVIPHKVAVLAISLFDKPHRADKAYAWAKEHLADYGYGDVVNLVSRIVHEHSPEFRGTYTNNQCMWFAAIWRGAFDFNKFIKGVYNHFMATTILPAEGIISELGDLFKSPLILHRFFRYNPITELLWSKETCEGVTKLAILTRNDIKAIVS